jgi:hypothetical protein
LNDSQLHHQSFPCLVSRGDPWVATFSDPVLPDIPGYRLVIKRIYVVPEVQGFAAMEEFSFGGNQGNQSAEFFYQETLSWSST